MSMIFSEYLSKPAIHFASLSMRRLVPLGEEGEYVPSLTFNLTPWNNSDIASGYLLAQVLNQTYHLSRDVVRTATLDPIMLADDDGYGILDLDGATDILCFVVPKHWGRQWQSLYNDLEETEYFSLHIGHIWERLENIHRAGVLVTSDMWRTVLSYWFIPDQCHNYRAYRDLEGQLNTQSLEDMMGPPGIKDFYLILPEISVDDWKSYYKKFPVVFHDHSGSYVEASERPVHQSVILRLWRLPGHEDSLYPYEGRRPRLDLNHTFESRVDATLHPHERVSLLLGLLEVVRYQKSRYDPDFPVEHQRPKRSIAIHLLVRNPVLPERNAGCSIEETLTYAPSPRTTTPLEAFAALELSTTRERTWLNLAIARIMVDSDNKWKEEAEADATEQND